MPLTLRTTLCEARDALHILRKAISVRGHIEHMEDIDTLIGVAEGEAVRAIKLIDISN
jgi:hypothetical protein